MRALELWRRDGAAGLRALTPAQCAHALRALVMSWPVALLPPAFLSVPLGTRWEKAGKTKPTAGKEVSNGALATALRTRLQFGREELDKFKCFDLRTDSYVKVGDEYFCQAALTLDALRAAVGPGEWRLFSCLMQYVDCMLMACHACTCPPRRCHMQYVDCMLMACHACTCSPRRCHMQYVDCMLMACHACTCSPRRLTLF